MKKKSSFDLKQQHVQKIYKENLKMKKSDHSMFLIIMGGFILGAILLAIASFIYNLMN